MTVCNVDDDQDDGARQPRWTSAKCEGSAQSRLQWHGQGHHARSVHLHKTLMMMTMMMEMMMEMII